MASRSLSALGFYISPYPVAFSSDGGAYLAYFVSCFLRSLRLWLGATRKQRSLLLYFKNILKPCWWVALS